MNGDETVSLIAAVGSLVLVGSALAARRLPAGRLGLMALVWIAIFIVAATLVALWQSVVHREPVIERAPSTPVELTSDLHNVYYRT